ncbi:hypothetical protein AVEN_220460-1 [Araneus ventricosus]|uniref:Histone-lysine N-methyltransferase SETMAR n=1 Tax=Araneus ventricosus TaxID=182803 RepID=A0A4Y2QEP9_ARAVE|nr:hypothetical protein AVEN_220460-1 [Araneus ventricosus]
MAALCWIEVDNVPPQELQNSHVILFCRQFIKSGVHCIQTKDLSRIFAAQRTALFDHPPYSPDLASSDYHLFLKLKEFLGCKRSGSDEELENAVATWINELAAEEYDMGIWKLVDRYEKYLNVGGDYVEK